MGSVCEATLRVCTKRGCVPRHLNFRKQQKQYKRYGSSTRLGIKNNWISRKTSGELAIVADVAVKAPETESYMILELHLPIYHCWCLMLETTFWKVIIYGSRKIIR